MLRKLLALLVLIPAQLFAQGVEYTVTPSAVGAPAPMENINQNNIGIPLNLGDDSTTGAINLGFQFSFYGQNFSSTYISNNGVIGFQSPINGCCQGYNLATNDQFTRYGIYVFQTDLLNIGTTNPYYKAFEDRFVVGWYNMALFGDGNSRSTYEITLFSGTNDILLNYGNVTSNRFFTAGIRGDDLAEYEIIYSGTDGNYMDFRSWLLSPGASAPEILYWQFIAGENQSFVLLTETTVRYGANGTFATLTLPPGTYSCSNSLFGDPLGGVVKACEIPSQNVDCTSDPTNPQCAVQAYTDPTTIATDLAEAAADAALADVNDTSTDTSNTDNAADEISEENGLTPVEEEILASSIEDDGQTLSEEESGVDESLEEMLAAESEEESSAEEIAAAEEEAAAQEEKAEKLADAIDPSLLNLVLSIVESTSVVDNSGASAGASSASSSSSSSASGSTIDSGSSGISTVNFAATSASAAAAALVGDVTISETDSSSSTELVAGTNIDNSGNIVGTTNVESSAVESEIEALQIVSASVTASTSTTESAFDDKTETDFPVLSFDPNSPLSQFVNNMPSIANQEAAGVLGNRQDKSDAEIRAEQVVAANKEEQDAINANYMDADQSGIVAAMGSDVDFTSYRSASLQDASLWYKPEDIYKNAVIPDNVRGSYFLEKGSTDTYKKMVEEQYK